MFFFSLSLSLFFSFSSLSLITSFLNENLEVQKVTQSTYKRYKYYNYYSQVHPQRKSELDFNCRQLFFY